MIRMHIFLIVLLTCVGAVAQRKPDTDPHKIITATLEPVIMEKVNWSMAQAPVTVTASRSIRSAGGRHDFYSEGDYWWPDPKSADSPYVQRDGLTNPDNFVDHRLAMIRFSQVVGNLASAFLITKNPVYAEKVMLHCRAWFIDTATRMNPHLLYAQAIKGRATGRGIGIIDAIQLMEVARGLQVIEKNSKVDKQLYAGFRNWFAEYLTWVTTHRYGIDEMNAKNNHGTCWVMQVAVFADFTKNKKLLEFCRKRFREVLVPNQIDPDGSFPLELKRTKPYGYTLFNMDAMATICQVLSNRKNNLWEYTTADYRGVGAAVARTYAFVESKQQWPYAKDVMYWNDWPVAQPFLVFASVAYSKKNFLDTWKRLEHDPRVEEVIRNLPVRNPLIWF